MKSNLDIPTLSKLGINREIIIFLEIARHPKGLSISDISRKMHMGRETVRYQTREMVRNGLVRLDQEINGGRAYTICKATPFGVDMVGKELKSLCSMISSIQEEMISKCLPKK
jgi:predicted transcriptional regulator